MQTLGAEEWKSVSFVLNQHSYSRYKSLLGSNITRLLVGTVLKLNVEGQCACVFYAKHGGTRTTGIASRSQQQSIFRENRTFQLIL